MLQALRMRLLLPIADLGVTNRAWLDLPCDVEAGMAIDIARIQAYHLGFTFALIAAASIQTAVEIGIFTGEVDWNTISTTDVPRLGIPGVIYNSYDELFIGTDAAAIPQALAREHRPEEAYFIPPLRLCQSRIQVVGLMRIAPGSTERYEVVIWYTPVRVTQIEALQLHEYWARTNERGRSVM
ncbi:hypothetical protein LCGC14_2161760 [marine sediment metagenome]|uniref:Uncharacterized protein n=1 Tax=marine sediment metagenome TaxID=412755 RepID=A0A0F9GNT7_9ZZZZ